MKRDPHKVVDQDGKPYIQVESKGYSPEEISAIILTKQKETTEAFLGKKIIKAVVPVPPYFNDAQKQATKDACFMAGYNAVTIINEPTSAGFAYGLHEVAAEKNYIVFDLGGATVDVSVLTIENGEFEILATTHNHFGGEDFNQRRIVGLLKKSLEDAGLKKQQIDDTILVGGSNINYPKVQRLLRDYFDGKEPKTSVKPDEAIAISAAVLGDALTEEWWDLMC
ncbi:luminal-binding protein 4-like [Bidens hawaiensis]|uniref:luminal-binding protein 4-like n=1 Tax=Bidens hawaiensis TaxID=980011 RepID=UPI00404B5CB8